MMSRELTSGSVFWSRGHFRMTKFSANIFVKSGDINIFTQFKMAAIGHFELVESSCGITHEGPFAVGIFCNHKTFFLIGILSFQDINQKINMQIKNKK